MTNPLAQADIERRISELDRRLESLVEDFAEAAVAAAQSEADYKRLYAESRLALIGKDGTQSEKEARAFTENAAEFEAWKLAEANYRTVRTACEHVQHQCELARSLNANIRPLVTP